MPRTEPFEAHADRYEAWFESHEGAYRSEVAALSWLRPAGEVEGVEIGVGTGRFAAPLGIEVGVDPARAMLARARERGVAPVRGVAEALPLRDGAFDVALLVTAICFVDSIPEALAEARRVLRPGGHLLIGYVDRDSPLGRVYQEKREENPFYRDATFVTADELLDDMEAAGFSSFAFAQTIFGPLSAIEEPDVREGYGEGSFVAVRARA